MDSTQQLLDIEIREGDDCSIIAVDKSHLHPYNNGEINRVDISFMLHNDEIAYSDVLEINNIHDLHLDNSIYIKTSFNIEKDGLYTYYKIVVPTLEYYKVEDQNDLYRVYEGGRTGHYFWYNGSVWYPDDTKFQGFEVYDISKYWIEDMCKEITDIKDLCKIWELDSSIFWYSCDLFTICHIRKCLLNKQKDLLTSYTNNNCKVCAIDSEIVTDRDFVMSSVFVLEYLIEHKLYNEAQRILDQIFTCGNTLCGSYITSKGCGCGKTV